MDQPADSRFSIVCVCVCVYSVRPSENNVSTPISFPLDSLQKKLKDLEDENKSLRSEVHTHTHTHITHILHRSSCRHTHTHYTEAPADTHTLHRSSCRRTHTVFILHLQTLNGKSLDSITCN